MQQPFKKLSIHQPSLPQVVATPRPERNKVVAAPTRLPINRQAALEMRQNRCWLEEPPAEKPKAVSPEEHARVLALLKIERNTLAEARDTIGTLREQIRELKEHLDGRAVEVWRLKATIQTQEKAIRELEDLKL